MTKSAWLMLTNTWVNTPYVFQAVPPEVVPAHEQFETCFTPDLGCEETMSLEMS